MVQVADGPFHMDDLEAFSPLHPSCTTDESLIIAIAWESGVSDCNCLEEIGVKQMTPLRDCNTQRIYTVLLF